MASPDNPLIIQSDRTLLLEVNHPGYAAARDALARFAELVKSPEHVHTYRVTPLSLWNAAAAGHGADEILDALERHSRYPLPPNVVSDIKSFLARYGVLRLTREGEGAGAGADPLVAADQRSELPLHLGAADPVLLREIAGLKAVKPLLGEQRDGGYEIPLMHRGLIKQALLRHGYPVEDRAGFSEGQPLPMALRDITRGGKPLRLRPYQHEAVAAFVAGEDQPAASGHGVVVLPCGAGKTLVGLATMARLQTRALILVTNITSARQWRDELLDKTTLTEADIGEYHGKSKEVRPVTIATYQVLTTRRGGAYTHFDLMTRSDWGLILYDEVHLLPAPVFRITAELQARRRLGLTATLVREDGQEGDVFCLIGPKRYDVPWKEMELQGYVAEATCFEIRLPLPGKERLRYALAEQKDRHRIAAENPYKINAAALLCKRHRGEPTLVIGTYLEQLRELARALQAPLLTGETSQAERERLLGEFRRGERGLLVVSKVANFSIDLPEASVCVQVSGSFGSRQEEAQRLGRVLRPKKDGGKAHFYSLVSRETSEQEFSMNRQLFLTEQGYRYLIEEWQPQSEAQVVEEEGGEAQVRVREPLQLMAGPRLLSAAPDEALSARGSEGQ